MADCMQGLARCGKEVQDWGYFTIVLSSSHLIANPIAAGAPAADRSRLV